MNVSVCMAVYNGERYLREQINSILLQLKGGDELIIYDDCSNDASGDIVRDYVNRFSNIVYVRGSENLGVLSAFSHAMAMSKNEIVVISDQDDVWMPNKLDLTRQAFFDSRVIGYLHNADIIYSDGRFNRKFYSEEYEWSFSIGGLLYSNSVIGCCLSFRRCVLDLALPVPSLISMHDWWLATNILMFGDIKFDRVSLIKYRRHDSNLSFDKRRSVFCILISRLKNLAGLLILFRRSRRLA